MYTYSLQLFIAKDYLNRLMNELCCSVHGKRKTTPFKKTSPNDNKLTRNNKVNDRLVSIPISHAPNLKDSLYIEKNFIIHFYLTNPSLLNFYEKETNT